MDKETAYAIVKLSEAQERINGSIKSLQNNELYPAYGLNSQVEGLELAVRIIERVIIDTKNGG